MGPIEPCRPKLRGTDERFCLQLFGLGVTHTTALEARDVSARVRGPIGPQRRGRPAGGPRRRDDSDALHSELDLPGDPGRVRRLLRPRSRLSVSTTCSGTVRTSSATSTRPPSRCSSPGASTPTGSPVSSGSCPPPGVDGRLKLILLGSRRSRLASPLIAASGETPWPIVAIKQVFLQALRRCHVIHRLHNAVAKVSVADQDSFKSEWWEGFDRITEPPGDCAVAEARRPLVGFRVQWERALPAAVACLVEGWESLTIHLRFPAEHSKCCGHTNLLERTFGETRCRTKVTSRSPGERSCVALVLAALDRRSRGWLGMTMSPRVLRRLQDLRRELLEEHGEPDAENVIPAAARPRSETCASSYLRQL